MSSTSALRNVISPKSSASMIAQPKSAGPSLDFLSPEKASSAAEQQLRILVDNVPVALAMFDEEMHYLLANRMWVDEFGLQNVTPLVGSSQYEVFPGLHPGWRQVYERALQGHVIRSEHDAMKGPDGRSIIYKWEVRPWRREADASVGGLMVVCEKFATDPKPAEAPVENHEAAPDRLAAVPTASSLLFQAALPVVVLDHEGVIIVANPAAATLSLSRGIREGETAFWDAFGEGRDHIAQRSQTLEAIHRLHESATATTQTLVTRTNAGHGDPDEAALPARWVLARTSCTEESKLLIAVALLGASPFDAVSAPKVTVQVPAAPPSPPPAPAPVALAAADAPSTAMLKQFQEQLERARQEVSVLREAEQSFTRREHRQRAVLEALPCGLVVVDENGMPIYFNDHIARLLGRGIERGETIEQWLLHACPTVEHREQVSKVWTNSVWRRQLTKTISLVTADGLLKELEFRPTPLQGGGILVSIHDVTETCRMEELLRSVEAKYRTVLQEGPAAVVLADRTGLIYECNAAAEKMLGRTKAELRKLGFDAWLDTDSAAARTEALRNMRETGRHSAELEIDARHSDGSVIPARMRIAVVLDASGQPHSTVHFIEEIPQQILTPEPTRLLGADALSREPVFADTPSPAPEPQTPAGPVVRWLLQTDINGRIAHWSNDAEQLFGIAADAATGRWLHSFFRPSDATGFYAEVQTRVTDPDTAVDWRHINGEGDRVSAKFFIKSTDDGGNAVDLFDITEAPPAAPTPAPAAIVAPHAPIEPLRTHTIRPSQLWPVADLDREKLMLSETHHRIKNHLQIISSMLNLQMNTLADTRARSALRNSQNRVRSIAALHQHLYQLALGEETGFAEFSHELAARLRECYEVTHSQVALTLDISNAQVRQEWLMPLALILNETLSNAFEHGFPKGREGTIHVSLRLAADIGEFEVTDNGTGLPEGFDPVIAPGLGLKILGVFAEQMGGELRLSGEPEKGTKFNLRFPIASIDN